MHLTSNVHNLCKNIRIFRKKGNVLDPAQPRLLQQQQILVLVPIEQPCHNGRRYRCRCVGKPLPGSKVPPGTVSASCKVLFEHRSPLQLGSLFTGSIALHPCPNEASGGQSGDGLAVAALK